MRWCAAVHKMPGAIHQVAIALNVDRQAAMLLVGECAANSGRRAVTLTSATGATNVLIVLVEGPQL